MDGATNVEAILDISGLPRLLGLRHVQSLLEPRIVVVAWVEGPGRSTQNARAPSASPAQGLPSPRVIVVVLVMMVTVMVTVIVVVVVVSSVFLDVPIAMPEAAR
jgi:hypothetical protein